MPVASLKRGQERLAPLDCWPCFEAALDLADAGYHPVPVNRGEKIPIASYRTTGGFDRSLRTRQGVEDAWRKYPQATLGISLTNLIQLDCDTQAAVEAVNALDLPKVPTIRTPRATYGEAGLRMIFRDDGSVFQKKAGKGRVEGIEWGRGSTMIAMVPPSFIEGDKSGDYESIYSMLEFDPVDLAGLPDLVNLMTPAPKERSSAGRSTVIPKHIPSGQRNNTLAQTAALLRSAGLSQDELVASLSALNEGDRVEGALPRSEIEGIVRSAMRVKPKPWSGPGVEQLVQTILATSDLSQIGKKDAIAVFRVLLNCSDSEGVCDPGPSLVYLGDQIGSRDGAKRGVTELEEAGLLLRTKRYKKATRYELVIPALL